MKTIQAMTIRKKIKEVWPKVGFMWLTDQKFSIISINKIKRFLKQSDLDKQEFIDHIQDCDDFALQLHAEAKRYFVQRSSNIKTDIRMVERLEVDVRVGTDKSIWNGSNLKYPLAFGECFATRWNGWDKKHNANICICEEGVYLIEPQTDEVHKGHSKNDNILIVRM